MTKIETHPLANGFIPKNVEKLIVGTFPPRDIYLNNNDFFFYASPKNHFWNRMDNIFPEISLKKTKLKCSYKTNAQNKLEKENFAKNKRLGFLDVFTKISRKADSANDADLICEEDILDNNKFYDILENNETLTRICCTYKLAYDHLKQKLRKSDYQIIRDEETANNEKILYYYKQRTIEILLLFPATRSSHKSIVKDMQYKKFLFDS